MAWCLDVFFPLPGITQPSKIPLLLLCLLLHPSGQDNKISIFPLLPPLELNTRPVFLWVTRKFEMILQLQSLDVCYFFWPGRGTEEVGKRYYCMARAIHTRLYYGGLFWGIKMKPSRNYISSSKQK